MKTQPNFAHDSAHAHVQNPVAGMAPPGFLEGPELAGMAAVLACQVATWGWGVVSLLIAYRPVSDRHMFSVVPRLSAGLHHGKIFILIRVPRPHLLLKIVGTTPRLPPVSAADYGAASALTPAGCLRHQCCVCGVCTWLCTPARPHELCCCIARGPLAATRARGASTSASHVRVERG